MKNNNSVNDNQAIDANVQKTLTTSVGGDFYLDLKKIQMDERIKRMPVLLNALLRLGVEQYRGQKQLTTEPNI